MFGWWSGKIFGRFYRNLKDCLNDKGVRFDRKQKFDLIWEVK